MNKNTTSWHKLSVQKLKSTELFSPGPTSYFLPSPWEGQNLRKSSISRLSHKNKLQDRAFEKPKTKIEMSLQIPDLMKLDCNEDPDEILEDHSMLDI